MDKTYRRELVRLFVVEQLPDPLTPREGHLQILDRYFAGTRLRLRTIRVPETKERTFVLEQLLPVAPGETRIGAIYLNESELAALAAATGGEIRKNRYYWESDGRTHDVDVYLGALAGLKIVRANFETADELGDFGFPGEGIEVTGDELFAGATLARKTFADVTARLAEIVGGDHAHDSHVREVAKESE